MTVKKRENNGFFAQVYDIVCHIPKGKVATYGMIAALAGSPRSGRIVGYALHVNPQPGIIPCHRVVNRFGATAPAFAFGGPDVQREMLEAEGVEFGGDGNVILDKHLWNGQIEDK